MKASALAVSPTSGGYRAATVNANLAPGIHPGRGACLHEQAAKRVLPATVQTDLSGQTREFRDSSSDILLRVSCWRSVSSIWCYSSSAVSKSFVDPLIIILSPCRCR